MSSSSAFFVVISVSPEDMDTTSENGSCSLFINSSISGLLDVVTSLPTSALSTPVILG